MCGLLLLPRVRARRWRRTSLITVYYLLISFGVARSRAIQSKAYLIITMVTSRAIAMGVAGAATAAYAAYSYQVEVERANAKARDDKQRKANAEWQAKLSRKTGGAAQQINAYFYNQAEAKLHMMLAHLTRLLAALEKQPGQLKLQLPGDETDATVMAGALTGRGMRLHVAGP